MSAEGKKLAIGIFCADWRLHQDKVRIIEALRDRLGADAVDVMAMPGPDGLFKAGREAECRAVLGWLKLLIGAHRPAAIAVVGHYDCAGNPADDPAHDGGAEETAAFCKKETGFGGPVLAFSAMRERDDAWSLKEVARV